MKKTPVVLVAVGIAGFLYHHSHQSSGPAQAEKPTTPTRVAQVNPTPTAPAQPSEHNWMKRSLDRASDVANQSRERLKQSQDP